MTIKDNALLDRYHASIDQGELSADPHQIKILEELQLIYNVLSNQQTVPPTPENTFTNIFKRKSKPENRIADNTKGLYLWGGVGRGKTHLVDLFYNLLPIKRKLRLHFHRFMQIVHQELGQLDDVVDPLQQVAKSFSKKAQILCLDEFHVIDITDAMLLTRLFKYLFDDGLVLITTSNFHPDELYKNGLQRERFLPAIELLKQNTRVVEMSGDVDYRSKALKQIGNYYLLSSNSSEEQLREYFDQLTGVELHQGRTDVIINDRRIPVKMWSAEVVWFSFEELCNSARSSSDYRQIATYFPTVFISDIPIMDSDLDDAARRFINMIDIFYDMHINIVVSAATEPDKLYQSKKLVFEFKRTVSRINEMQTYTYIKVKKTVKS